MQLSIKALTLAAGIGWALAVLITSLANLIWPGYGVAFLAILDSVYPGFTGPPVGFGDAIVGTLYAFVDGAVCGAVFGWLYNRFAAGSAGATNP